VPSMQKARRRKARRNGRRTRIPIINECKHTHAYCTSRIDVVYMLVLAIVGTHVWHTYGWMEVVAQAKARLSTIAYYQHSDLHTNLIHTLYASLHLDLLVYGGISSKSMFSRVG
jgi:hypothetical protein